MWGRCSGGRERGWREGEGEGEGERACEPVPSPSRESGGEGQQWQAGEDRGDGRSHEGGEGRAGAHEVSAVSRGSVAEHARSVVLKFLTGHFPTQGATRQRCIQMRWWGLVGRVSGAQQNWRVSPGFLEHSVWDKKQAGCNRERV